MKQRLMSIVQPGSARRGYALVALALILVLCAGSVLAEPAAEIEYDLTKLVLGNGASYYRMSDMNFTEWMRLVDIDDESKGWEISPSAKLIEGWELKLVEAKQYYNDADGKLRSVSATGVVAVPAVGNPDLVDYRFREVLKSDVADGVADCDAINDAILSAFPDYMLQLLVSTSIGAIGTTFISSDEIDRIVATDETDAQKRARLKRQELRNGHGLQLVQDPREITMIPTSAEVDQLLGDYAGQQVLVEFANGSLWSFYDDVSIGKRYVHQKGSVERAEIYAKLRLITLTKLSRDDILKRAAKVLWSLYTDQMVPKEQLEDKLFPALCQEFGIDEAKVEDYFELCFA